MGVEALVWDYPAALAGRSNGLSVRVHNDADASFVRTLFIACSPLKDVLPAQMLREQAAAQAAAHDGRYPNALRYIVLQDAQPAGRIMLDASGLGVTRCVDVAVSPEHQRRGLGTAMLRAWLDLADRYGYLAQLSVLRQSPALALYRRLGFRPEAGDDGAHPIVMMDRPAESLPVS